MTLKAQATKVKLNYIRKWNVCASKDTLNRVERQPTKWEKIFANPIRFGINIHNILIWSVQQQQKAMLLKDISPRKPYKWPKQRMQFCSVSLLSKCKPNLHCRIHSELFRYLLYSLGHSLSKKDPENNKCWQGCRKNGTLVHCWWERKMVQPLEKTVWGLFKEFKIELLQNTIILLLSIYPQNWNQGLKEI